MEPESWEVFCSKAFLEAGNNFYIFFEVTPALCVLKALLHVVLRPHPMLLSHFIHKEGLKYPRSSPPRL